MKVANLLRWRVLCIRLRSHESKVKFWIGLFYFPNMYRWDTKKRTHYHWSAVYRCFWTPSISCTCVFGGCIVKWLIRPWMGLMTEAPAYFLRTLWMYHGATSSMKNWSWMCDNVDSFDWNKMCRQAFTLGNFTPPPHKHFAWTSFRLFCNVWWKLFCHHWLSWIRLSVNIFPWHILSSANLLMAQ